MFRAWIAVSLLLLSCASSGKPVVGQSVDIHQPGSGLNFVARVDTGASISSIHAVDIEVLGGEAESMKDNIGKRVRFTTEGRGGVSKTIEARIVKVTTVSNSQGTESRYTVELELQYEQDLRNIRVNLRDRGHMDYKLLLGRNWLEGHYLVDVAEKNVIGERAPIHLVEGDITFDTRIDTGAVENSLHAIDIQIEDENPTDMEANVGKRISFTTGNEKGETRRIHSRITETSLIRNAQGSEVRYMVELTLGEPGKEFKVKVNLKDRSQMSHKLLIGRNWLQGHYVVDVSR
ncbi:RimK/LysX family protein [Shewanella litorisediminis]|uniref:ATP-dependent zinc protease n=1 Tax=Shewanella litorisediminis TaxID=1173586 RepID=A0ABX7FYY6_9GAMM|nr:RimK/LysX family protein [Shewanella litorisediminis]MCL2918786.1 RimK/LysX family protein [Shewanella litorisediminis]QRH00244.1 ATP-dependent zinc protease [Shewanella litorisediminis]